MSELFLHLSDEERRDVYTAASVELGLPAKILEKDVWICWTLGTLFGDSGRYPMAFKGETSLSKVYAVISRFSEDIDITVSTASSPADVVLPTSTNKADTLRAAVEVELDEYLQDHVRPLLGKAIVAIPGGSVDAVAKVDKETIVLDYPSCFMKGGVSPRTRQARIRCPQSADAERDPRSQALRRVSVACRGHPANRVRRCALC